MAEVNFSFEVAASDPSSSARAGLIRTAHGVTPTPAFMPVATHAVMRGINTEIVHALSYGTILANTYHLLLRPGVEVFKKFNGIHNYMKWDRSVLTDSGGFQIFSLSDSITFTEEAAIFRSYVDGKKIALSPEESIATQRAINSDIMMVLDQCIPALSDRSTTLQAAELTHRWAKRSFVARGDSSQALFGIVQGACFLDLRSQSAEQICSIDFDGYAIGGVAVGEEKAKRAEVIAHTARLLPGHKPRYLMGVGTPLDILEAVACGLDMFDCILPTAFAQQGVCFTSRGKVDLRRGVYKMDESPLDADCQCPTCRNYSRSYLHHLIKAGEYTGGSLLSLHNLTFYRDLMQGIRGAILSNTFPLFYRTRRQALEVVDPEYPRLVAAHRTPVVNESLGDYRVLRRAEAASIQHIPSGEVMHSVVNPNVEAKSLYVDQSGFCERILDEQNEQSTLVLWDVGLGAAYNAMAAIRAYEYCHQKTRKAHDGSSQNSSCRPFDLCSFENDLNPLKLALKNLKVFPHLRHPAPLALLQRGVWESKKVSMRWKLYEGDFVACLSQSPAPDIIYYDPFSFKTNPEFWTLEMFQRLFELSIENRTCIYTYTAATSIRAAMLAAGFFVAKGRGSGPKSETTVAMKLADLEQPNEHKVLGPEWLDRWERSTNRFPPGLPSNAQGLVEERIRKHPQFAKV